MFWFSDNYIENCIFSQILAPIQEKNVRMYQIASHYKFGIIIDDKISIYYIVTWNVGCKLQMNHTTKILSSSWVVDIKKMGC